MIIFLATVLTLAVGVGVAFLFSLLIRIWFLFRFYGFVLAGVTRRYETAERLAQP